MQPVPKHGRGVQNPSVFHQICSKLCERQHFAMKSELFNFCFRMLLLCSCFQLPGPTTFLDRTGKPQLFWGKSTSLQGKCGSSDFKLYIDMFPTIAFLIAFCSPDFLAQQSIMEYTDYSHAKSVLAAFFAPANSNHTAQHAADT